MSVILPIHPDNPQKNRIIQVAEASRKGEVIAYPTDSTYALGCQIGNKIALERIKKIRQLDENHKFTLICRDLSELGNYAKVNNNAFRLIKALVPGPYTFILQATREVPKRLLHSKQKTIGIRIPDHKLLQAVLAELDAPLMNTTLQLPGMQYPLTTPVEIKDLVGNRVDLIVEGGSTGIELTTVIDLVEEPVLVRQGKGDITSVLSTY